MKKYVRSSTDATLTLPISGDYVTKRHNIYKYRIEMDGTVEVWENISAYNSVNRRSHITERILKSVPKEMQNYLIDTYGTQLSEMGITLKF